MGGGRERRKGRVLPPAAGRENSLGGFGDVSLGMGRQLWRGWGWGGAVSGAATAPSAGFLFMILKLLHCSLGLSVQSI